MSIFVEGVDNTPVTDKADFHNPCGQISIYNNAVATTITTQNTNTLFNKTTALQANANLFDSPQAGRLRYTGTDPFLFHVGCTLTVSSAGTNDIVRASLFTNGTVNGNNEFTGGTENTTGVVESKLGAPGDLFSTAIHCYLLLNTNNYIELAINNISAVQNVTVKHFNLFAMGMFCIC